MACGPRRVSPTWCELLFALLHNKPNTLICAPEGQQVPSHPGPHWLFPLCWAQCSFLATQFLILALLAYLNLAETKHGFIWWFASEERWWWHFVVNCLHVWGRLDMFYLGRAGKNKDREFICSVLRMFCFLKRYWANGWWLWGLLACLLMTYCFSVSLCKGIVCLLAQTSVSSGLSLVLNLHSSSAAPWVQWASWVSRC